jgi:hypothetical protein
MGRKTEHDRDANDNAEKFGQSKVALNARRISKSVTNFVQITGWV